MHYYIVITISLLAIIMLIVLISTRNRFVVLLNCVKEQETQLYIQLKRKNDLIPNLINIIKEHVNFDEINTNAVITANYEVINANGIRETLSADKQLSDALSILMKFVENLPELRTNHSFLSLQKELSEIDNKIEYTSQFYNDMILRYNNEFQIFPLNIIATFYGFNEIPFVTLREKKRENIVVNA